MHHTPSIEIGDPYCLCEAHVDTVSQTLQVGIIGEGIEEKARPT